jgi:hypothetical protein
VVTILLYIITDINIAAPSRLSSLIWGGYQICIQKNILSLFHFLPEKNIFLRGSVLARLCKF